MRSSTYILQWKRIWLHQVSAHWSAQKVARRPWHAGILASLEQELAARMEVYRHDTEAIIQRCLSVLFSDCRLSSVLRYLATLHISCLSSTGHEALQAHTQICFCCSATLLLLTVSELFLHGYNRMTNNSTYLSLKSFSHLFPAHVQGCHPSVLVTFTENHCPPLSKGSVIIHTAWGLQKPWKKD